MAEHIQAMEGQPNYQSMMRVVWNRDKSIPPTSTYTITITLETSIEVESIKLWLLESLGSTMQGIASKTNSTEQLISIETTKLK